MAPLRRSYALAMMAALLHDVVDDTSVDLAAIQAKFGSTVASMVANISKLSQMNQLLRRGKRKVRGGELISMVRGLWDRAGVHAGPCCALLRLTWALLWHGRWRT